MQGNHSIKLSEYHTINENSFSDVDKSLACRQRDLLHVCESLNFHIIEYKDKAHVS